jgi:hypothetical protein
MAKLIITALKKLNMNYKIAKSKTNTVKYIADQKFALTNVFHDFDVII